MTASISPAIFRAYDIRGVVGEGLDSDSVWQIGRSIGSEARQRGVMRIALGRDGRQSSETLGEALCRGLQASGVDVLDVGCVPTPLLYFAAYQRCSGSGVMVTGSHNPPQYNGLKVMLAGETLHGEAIQALYRRIVEERFVAGQGRREADDLREEYLVRMAAAVGAITPSRVVVDCGNGVAGLTAPALLERLGCEVVPLYCEPDGRFPHHHPDPNRPENLETLRQVVLREGADIGIAFDGDGDRLGVVSARGEIIWPDRLMMLFARDLLERHPGSEVIYDIKCSRHLGQVIDEAGGQPSMWRTGHSMLKARMVERGALLAGEMSGHIFLREGWFGFDDALYAAARLLALLSADGRGGSVLFDELPDALSTPELHLEMAEGEPQALLERILVQADRFTDAVLTTLDGLRVDYSDGWGLVRASNTTPTLVLRFEADDNEALQRIEQRFRELLLQLEPTLKLPF